MVRSLIDRDDSLDLASLRTSQPRPPTCPESGRIFKLVRKLARKYQDDARLEHPPVPADLITQVCRGLPLEIRRIPLKSVHGAIWRLGDAWVIHLNSNDTPARQRFTLYHEIFHILAHSKATPVFRKSSCGREGSFNELLADHFAAVMLMPAEWVKKLWPEIKDVGKMAAIFYVPESVMYLGLQFLGLI